MPEKIDMDPELDQLLRQAIHEKRLVRFRYKDQVRIVEPHDYGVQKGIVRLFCYQVGGESHNRLPGWRLVDVPSMQNFVILEQHFPGNRDTSTGKHHAWDEVFLRVAPPKTLFRVK